MKSEFKNKSRRLSLSPLHLRSSVVVLGLIAFGVVAAGFTLPWWGLIGPAALGGAWYSYADSKLPISAVLVRVAGLVALVWMAAILVNDVVAAGRLSARIAAVMSLPNFILAYVLSAMIAAFLAALAALVGYYVVQIASQSFTTTR